MGQKGHPLDPPSAGRTSLLDQAMPEGGDGSARSIGHTEGLQDVRDVSLDGADREMEPIGDLPVREATGDQPQHLQLTLRQDRRLLARVGKEPFRWSPRWLIRAILRLFSLRRLRSVYASSNTCWALAEKLPFLA